jgi:hypothetical protein
MAKKKELCKDKRGLYQRNLGWKQTDKGYAQQKFYLGRDETKARIASLKLEQLWDAVCARWDAAEIELLLCVPLVRLLPPKITLVEPALVFAEFFLLCHCLGSREQVESRV